MAGPDADFEELFQVEYSSLVRAVFPIVADVGDAEAIVQEAFVKASVRWETVRRFDRPGAWVRRVAIRDAVRHATRRRRPWGLPSPSTGIAESVTDRVDLDRALSRLPARQRAAVVLHHLLGWPAAEVAETLGCAESTVRVHLHRGRTALAAMLTDDAEGVSDGRR
ncbi:RNA polymerase sigma factor [Actinomarinicola tropica]|uniref:Sigma-70 family RNA polymerase sigma factor n=1 Tax=Actinomarinicola tropica TaxID=2789776 RepID=A0A5Q2RIX3_9ACTN|nr:sigma-70 family RNA polymerase sigma factor [Actinomarinicola tropica]QGG96808.1 sigma-70 family RNA polymerase sigma factor [Actinomarinicola tropica]